MHPIIFLDGADDGAVLEAKWDGDEDEVEEEHGNAKSFVHLPAEARDTQHHEAEHPEEHQHRAGHARTAHGHRSVHHAVQQPRERQPCFKRRTYLLLLLLGKYF